MTRYVDMPDGHVAAIATTTRLRFFGYPRGFFVACSCMRSQSDVIEAPFYGRACVLLAQHKVRCHGERR